MLVSFQLEQGRQSPVSSGEKRHQASNRFSFRSSYIDVEVRKNKKEKRFYRKTHSGAPAGVALGDVRTPHTNRDIIFFSFLGNFIPYLFLMLARWEKTKPYNQQRGARKKDKSLSKLPGNRSLHADTFSAVAMWILVQEKAVE